jgi:hypothetical protein
MGKKLTLNNTDSTFTAEAKDSIVDKMLTGVTGMFSDAETTAYTADILLWGQVATNAANAVATSMFTRKRVERGEEAVFGVLF